jgi:hypothetical protein
MRPFVALSLAAFASPVLSAPDPFDVFVANIEILQAKPVQAELKISESQRAALNKHAEWYNGLTRKAVERVNAASSDKDRQKGLKEIAGLQERLKTKVIGELSHWQVRRLAQISLQQAGIVALLDTRVAKRIGLTDAQVKRLREGWDVSGRMVAEAEDKARRPVFEKYKNKRAKDNKEAEDLRKAFAQDMEAASRSLGPVLAKAKRDFESVVDSTLTPGQKKAWHELKGPSFRAQ